MYTETGQYIEIALFLTHICICVLTHLKLNSTYYNRNNSTETKKLNLKLF